MSRSARRMRSVGVRRKFSTSKVMSTPKAMARSMADISGVSSDGKLVGEDITLILAQPKDTGYRERYPVSDSQPLNTAPTSSSSFFMILARTFAASKSLSVRSLAW